MYKLCVFAGTADGRELIERLTGRGVSITAYVATEYGRVALGEYPDVEVRAGGLPRAEMPGVFRAERFDLVVDATHPYAEHITESIRLACEETGTELIRLLRESTADAEDGVFVEDTAECIRFLTGTEGNILLTTGSKTVPEYCAAPGLRERIWARLLPLPSSLESCREGGLEPSHILAMQGPFTEELNTAMLRFVNAKWLVTKDTGSAGGYADKIAAARAAGAKAVIIGRPAEREGLSGAETLSAVERKFSLPPARKKVIMAGIGMGSEDTRTLGVLRAVAEAECVIGARRMGQSVDTTGKRVCEAVLARDIAAIVREGSERVYTVLLSGDTGFYSGAKSLLRELGDETDNEVLPGIGSLTYFCARLKRPWENVRAISLHGRRCDFVREVRYNAAVFSLLGGEVGAKEALRMLADAGLGGVTVHIGENLGYPEERIVSGTAEELLDREFAPLCVLLAENDKADDEPVTYGLPDEAFDRDKVPMTKEEVRGVCVSRAHRPQRGEVWPDQPGGRARHRPRSPRSSAGAHPRLHRRQQRQHARDRGPVAGKEPEGAHRGHGGHPGDPLRAHGASEGIRDRRVRGTAGEPAPDGGEIPPVQRAESGVHLHLPIQETAVTARKDAGSRKGAGVIL